MDELDRELGNLLAKCEIGVELFLQQSGGEIHDFVILGKKYLFRVHAVGIKIEVNNKEIPLMSFKIYIPKKSKIYGDNLLIDSYWTADLDILRSGHVDKQIEKLLPIPPFSPLSFLYHLTLNIARHLRFIVYPNSLKFSILLEYEKKDIEYVLKDATMYTVGIYSEIDPYNLPEIDFGEMLLPLLRSLGYQFESDVMIKLSAWWMEIFKKVLIKFHKALFEACGVVKPKK